MFYGGKICEIKGHLLGKSRDRESLDTQAILKACEVI
jgi:hypothetical protein